MDIFKLIAKVNIDDTMEDIQAIWAEWGEEGVSDSEMDILILKLKEVLNYVEDARRNRQLDVI